MSVVKYLLALFIIIGAIGALASNSPIAGLLLAILGIVLLPPISKVLSHKVKFWNVKIARYGIYVMLFILVGATMKRSPNAATNGSVQTIGVNDTRVVDKPQRGQLITEEKQMDNSDFWKKFDPIVKDRIYKLIKEKNCQGLQAEFTVTADNMDRIQASGGDGSRNLDLLAFLEEQMQDLDCY